jgi:hypothetical protein
MAFNHWEREVCANCHHQFDGLRYDAKAATALPNGERFCRIYSNDPPMPAKYHPLRLDLLSDNLAWFKPDWCDKWRFYGDADADHRDPRP